MSRMSNKVDGVAFAMYQGRFSGTVDLEDEEAEATAIGETLVMVVVATVKDLNAKMDKDGDLARVAVFKATDARILDDELKDLLVERLGLYGGDTVEPVLIAPGTRRQPEEAEVETGEIEGFSEPENEQLSFDDVEVLTPERSEGPKTVPYNTMPSFVPEATETVGVVGKGDEAWRDI